MKILNIRSTVLVVLLMWSLHSQAQFQAEIDSLLRIVNTIKEDTTKVKVYGDLSWNIAGNRTNMETALVYADSMRWLSEKLGFEEGIVRSYLCYGVIHRYQGDYKIALDYFKKHVDYFKEKGNIKREAAGLFQLGVVNQELGNFDQSMSAFEYILKIHEATEDWNGVARTYNSIGIIYKKMEKYEQAIKTYQKAIMVNDSFNLGRDLTFITFNMGNSYIQLNDYEAALATYQKSMSIAEENNNAHGITINLSALGEINNLLNRNEVALDYQLKALSIHESLNQKRDVLLNLMEIGKTYTKLNQHNLAQNSLMRARDIALELGTKEFLRNTYGYLTDHYLAVDDFRQAYQYKNLYHQIDDSIFSETKVQQINELQTKYETAEKDQQIALLAKENELKEKEAQRQATLKKAFIGAGLLIALIAALLFFTLRQRLRSQKELAKKDVKIKEVNYQRKLSELEMKALQAQINPHFIFNCLNSINQMILEGQDTQASRYLTKFSKLIRLILENAESSEITLQEELTLLESYIELEKLRFQGNIEYKWHVDSQIDPEDTYLPSMVLQPFVENAIWHGLMTKPDQKGCITLEAKQEGNLLVCKIEDNGVGRAKAQELQNKSIWKSKSLGLKITEERLGLLNREFVGEMIRITDLVDPQGRASGTRVQVSIPT